jgi:hypothetical protein
MAPSGICMGKKKAQENLTANVHELYKPKDKLRAKDMTMAGPSWLALSWLTWCKDKADVAI